MPCFNCQKIQTDPVKGSSPWARGVISGTQILICPDCQSADPTWTTRLDRCPECASTRLTMVMGSISCRQCGFVS